ncbi:MAG: methyltransferase domain-containing protein [Burkholderiaceae bacterium]
MIEQATRSVLNVGGNSKAIPLPPQYDGFEHLLLDIDPTGAPDVVCDARNLATLAATSFDAIYCSHNLEHYFGHEVGRVLAGFLHVLKDGGFAHIRVPDMQELMRQTIERGLDIEDVLYESPVGPIRVLDVIYGHGPQIASSGHDFFAHKTGFTRKSLHGALARAGFSAVYSGTANLEVTAVAFKGLPDPEALALFNLQPA